MTSFRSTVLLAFLVSISLSCSDEEIRINPEEQLSGTWNMSAVDYSGTSVTSAFGTEITAIYSGEGYDMDLQLIFDKASKAYSTSGNYSIKLTYVIDGGEPVTQNWANQGFVLDGEYSVQGDKLILTPAGQESQETIFSIVDKNKLEISQIRSQVINQSGMTITQNIEIVYLFTR